ncbi:hypothetical protein K3495_g5695 [Podosphaera aphanis]|nr:hypothetical protein K3495_g5695 [Podosphaera aphanis]
MTLAPNLTTSYPAGFGLTTLCIGLTYLLTSRVPIEENQFLHASIPIRGVLVTVAAYRALAMRGLTATQKKDLLGVVVWDGIGALALGYSLGTFKGMPLAYQ